MDRDNDKDKEHFTDTRLKGLKTAGLVGQVTALVYVVLLIFLVGETDMWISNISDILILPIIISDIWVLCYLPTVLELNVDYENAYEVLKEKKA